MMRTLLCVLVAFSATVAADCPAPGIDPLHVTGVPTLVEESSGVFTLDTLTLVFEAPAYANRSLTSIEMSSTAECNFDGTTSAVWTHTAASDLNGCKDIYTLTIDWDYAVANCGLESDNSAPNAIVWTGNVTFAQIDKLDQIRGNAVERDVITSIAFGLVFPKSISVSSDNIAVVSPAALKAAISSQQFVKPSNKAVLRLYTSLQWPFELTNPTIAITDNTELTSVIALESSSCSTPGPCTATYLIEVTRSSDICNFTGEYKASFGLQCAGAFVSGGGDCPLQGETASVTFTVESDNTCGTFRDTVDLTGTLKSYLADYTTPRTGFMLGQRAYFVVDVDSEKATIVGTELVSASSQQGALTAVSLYEAGLVAAAGQAADVQFASDTAPTDDTARFNYKFGASMYTLDEDETATAVVTALVTVEFRAGGSPTKRGTMKLFRRQSGSQNVPASVVVGVSRSTSTPDTTSKSEGGKGGLSGAAMFGIGAACVVVVALAAVAALVIVKRMRKPATGDVSNL